MQHPFFQSARARLQQAMAWVMCDDNKARARQLCSDASRAFTEHPSATGETYLEHLWFTTKMSARFFYTTLVIVIHGLFPFLLGRAASDEIEAIYREMKRRIPKSRREAIDAADDYCV